LKIILKPVFIIAILAVTMIGVMVPSVFAEEEVQMTLTLDKKEYYLGEPINVEISVDRTLFDTKIQCNVDQGSVINTNPNYFSQDYTIETGGVIIPNLQIKPVKIGAIDVSNNPNHSAKFGMNVFPVLHHGYISKLTLSSHDFETTKNTFNIFETTEDFSEDILEFTINCFYGDSEFNLGQTSESFFIKYSMYPPLKFMAENYILSMHDVGPEDIQKIEYEIRQHKIVLDGKSNILSTLHIFYEYGGCQKYVEECDSLIIFNLDQIPSNIDFIHYWKNVNIHPFFWEKVSNSIAIGYSNVDQNDEFQDLIDVQIKKILEVGDPTEIIYDKNDEIQNIQLDPVYAYSSTHIENFPDPTKSPQHYIDRYNNEPTYKEWFDLQFPDITIYEAVDLDATKKIPNWVKIIFGFYSQDKISEDELLNAIQYLIDEEILKVN
jgi:hypothetical protein